MKYLILIIFISLNICANSETAYTFNKFGIYSGTIKCQKNPLESGYLLPRGATWEKPPYVGVNEVAIWANTHWSINNDYRGTWYNKLNKTRMIIKDIGTDYPIGYTRIKPPTQFHIWSINQWVLDQTAKDNYDNLQIIKTKINGLFKKERNKILRDIYQSIKLNNTLSAEEINYVDNIINNLDI